MAGAHEGPPGVAGDDAPARLDLVYGTLDHVAVLGRPGTTAGRSGRRPGRGEAEDVEAAERVSGHVWSADVGAVEQRVQVRG